MKVVTAVCQWRGVSTVRAGQWALAGLPDEIDMANAQIRMVVPLRRLRRIMSVTGADQVLPLYWSLAEAMAGAPGPLRSRRPGAN